MACRGGSSTLTTERKPSRWRWSAAAQAFDQQLSVNYRRAVGFLHSKRTATGRAQIVKAQVLLQESHGSGFEWQNPISAVASSVHLRVTPDNGGPEFDSATHAMGGDESHLMEGH